MMGTESTPRGPSYIRAPIRAHAAEALRIPAQRHDGEDELVIRVGDHAVPISQSVTPSRLKQIPTI